MLYCNDDVHSQQNRCLVSGSHLQLASKDEDHVRARIPTRGGVAGYMLLGAAPLLCSSHLLRLTQTWQAAFFQLLEKQLAKYKSVLPMDLRVRGLVSAKFDYDGSALPWDPSREGK